VEAAHPSEHKKTRYTTRGKIPKVDNFIKRGPENLKNIKILHEKYLYVISGFHRSVNAALALLRRYAALIGRQLPTLNDRHAVPKRQ
jgi:hypothetical protein